MPMFSVVIPTRNRADLFRRALDSVASQEGADYEIIVVNDGTSGEQLVKLNAIRAEFAGRARFIDLPTDAGGHGCFRVMNTGASQAAGDYICFLDDDDAWVGTDHLANACRIVQAGPEKVDVIFFDQAAFRGVDREKGPVWIEDLGSRLVSSGQPNAAGAYKVEVNQLLTAHGFSHTNVTIVSKEFFFALGGFDTTLWYEGDRDFYLRCIDRARELRYLPKISARHNIPDQALRSSMSNSTSALRKALDQTCLLHKAARHSRHDTLRAYARAHRKYSLRKAAEATLKQPELLWSFVKAMPRVLRSRPSGRLVTVI